MHNARVQHNEGAYQARDGNTTSPNQRVLSRGVHLYRTPGTTPCAKRATRAKHRKTHGVLGRIPAGVLSVHQAETGPTRHYRMGMQPVGPNRRVHVRAGGEGGRAGPLTRASWGAIGGVQPGTRAAPKAGLTHGEYGAFVRMEFQAMGGMQEPPLAPTQEKLVAPKVPTTAKHAGSGHTGAHTCALDAV